MYINQTICVIFCIARTLIIISFYKWDMVINQINKKRFAYYHKNVVCIFTDKHQKLTLFWPTTSAYNNTSYSSVDWRSMFHRKLKKIFVNSPILLFYLQLNKLNILCTHMCNEYVYIHNMIQSFGHRHSIYLNVLLFSQRNHPRSHNTHSFLRWNSAHFGK